MKFSALLCLYRNNDHDEVQDAINSAFMNQTMPPTELVVVFDGPVPEKVEAVINTFAKKNSTQIIRFKENRGHGPARAAGVEASRYEWVAIIDSDDVSMPHRFESLIQEIKCHPDLAVVGGGLTEFIKTEEGIELGAVRIFPASHKDVSQFMKMRSPVAQPTCMLRRAAVLEVGNYHSWFNNEDYHLWIRLVAAGFKIHNVSESILLFRVSPDIYLRRGGFKYWWNEVRLQAFSLRQGTTTLMRFLPGACLRFVIQVLLPNKLRASFYKRILR